MVVWAVATLGVVLLLVVLTLRPPRAAPRWWLRMTRPARRRFRPRRNDRGWWTYH